MRGIGRASGSISILNALFTGSGCAAAIDLRCEAIAEIERTVPGELPSVVIARDADTPLVRAAARAALRSIAPTEHLNLQLRVQSAVPSQVGLKSSSAVSCAVLDAIHRAVGQRPDPLELARTSAEVTSAVGLSATGAFDDACASLLGGIVRTDNRSRELRQWAEFTGEWAVRLWVPPRGHPPSPTLADRFAGFGRQVSEVEALIDAGEYFPALERNSELVEQAMGYRYAKVRERVRALGAVAAGVSGMGPALAVVAPQDRIAPIQAFLGTGPGAVLATRFRAPEAGDAAP